MNGLPVRSRLTSIADELVELVAHMTKRDDLGVDELFERIEKRDLMLGRLADEKMAIQNQLDSANAMLVGCDKEREMWQRRYEDLHARLIEFVRKIQDAGTFKDGK